MRVFVTGASGFVGRAVLRRLVQEGHDAVGGVRRPPEAPITGAAYVQGANLLADAHWVDALAGTDAVIHAAARVHVMDDSAADPLAEFRRVNVEGSLRLARAAIKAGVRQFVFLSSVKANGETSEPGRPFCAVDLPCPQDPYGISKLEAEQALFKLGRESGLKVTVVRPPLVYGPGVKSNFRAMMGLLRRRVPLPLGAVQAKRSLVALDNLVDLLVRCLDKPAPGKVFLVSDGHDLTVSDMLRRLGIALGRRPILLNVPPAIIERAAQIMGKTEIAQRLLKPLQVDISATRAALSWSPPVSVDEAFARTAAAFLQEGQ